jgi:tripartite-type tricarboxylate transporter receptor subunit TctC
MRRFRLPSNVGQRQRISGLDRRQLLASGFASFFLGSEQEAAAQFGKQPVKIIFPFAAGGSGDAVARLIAEHIGIETGQGCVVENRTGANGMLGVQAVKQAAPDGTTLLLTPFTLMVIYPHIYPALRYNPATDFAPISQITSFEFAIAVSKTVPARTAQELVNWVKANPGKGSYGTPGAGTLPHFFGLAFARAANIEMQHVPYRGASAAVAELVAGQIPIAVLSTADVLEFEKNGDIHVIATLDETRSPYLPQRPTLKESGYDLNGNGWFGLYAPAGTPADTIERINAIVNKLVKSEGFRERTLKLGLQATGTSPVELARIQQAEAAKWEPVVKASGFHPQD